MESGCFNNENFWQYSYFGGEFCSLETGIPGGRDNHWGPVLNPFQIMKVSAQLGVDLLRKYFWK